MTNGIVKTKRKSEKNSTYHRTWSQTHHLQNLHQANLNIPMTANKAHVKARDAIKGIFFRNAQNRTRHVHPQVTRIRPTKVVINSIEAIIRRAIAKKTLSNYAQN